MKELGLANNSEFGNEPVQITNNPTRNPQHDKKCEC